MFSEDDVHDYPPWLWEVSRQANISRKNIYTLEQTTGCRVFCWGRSPITRWQVTTVGARGAFKLSGCDWTGEMELTDLDRLAVMQLRSRLSGELFHARLCDCRGKTVTSASAVKPFSSSRSELSSRYKTVCVRVCVCVCVCRCACARPCRWSSKVEASTSVCMLNICVYVTERVLFRVWGQKRSRNKHLVCVCVCVCVLIDTEMCVSVVCLPQMISLIAGNTGHKHINTQSTHVVRYLKSCVMSNIAAFRCFFWVWVLAVTTIHHQVWETSC